MEDAEKVSAGEELERLIQGEIWNFVRDLGRGYSAPDTLSQKSDSEVEQYARGYRHALLGIAEQNCGVRSDHLPFSQIDAALGQRLRRANSPNQFLPGRARVLNQVLLEVRDKRIGMLERHEMLEYQEYRTWKKRVSRFELGNFEDHEYANWQIVSLELSAIWELHSHLISDKAWFAKYWEAKQKVQVAA